MGCAAFNKVRSMIGRKSLHFVLNNNEKKLEVDLTPAQKLKRLI